MNKQESSGGPGPTPSSSELAQSLAQVGRRLGGPHPSTWGFEASPSVGGVGWGSGRGASVPGSLAMWSWLPGSARPALRLG